MAVTVAHKGSRLSYLHLDVAQSGSAYALEAWGRRFESFHLDLFLGVYMSPSRCKACI
jgi:hypothetical protein